MLPYSAKTLTGHTLGAFWRKDVAMWFARERSRFKRRETVTVWDRDQLIGSATAGHLTTDAEALNTIEHEAGDG